MKTLTLILSSLLMTACVGEALPEKMDVAGTEYFAVPTYSYIELGEYRLQLSRYEGELVYENKCVFLIRRPISRTAPSFRNLAVFYSANGEALPLSLFQGETEYLSLSGGIKEFTGSVLSGTGISKSKEVLFEDHNSNCLAEYAQQLDVILLTTGE